MFPQIVIFNKTITMYVVMSTIGLLVAGFYACYKTKKLNRDDNEMLSLLLISCIGIIIGSHLLYGITNFKYLIIIFNNLENYKTIWLVLKDIIIVFGGAVFYGGLFGGLLVGFVYYKKKKLDSIYLDIVAATIPLFHSIARIGCFLVGCCYGIKSKFGFTFENSLVEEANHVNRFPVQLLESFLNLILFLVLNKLLTNKKYKGKLIYIYLGVYAIIRFFLEFLRGDYYRGIIGFLSTSQFISIIILLCLITTMIIKFVKKRKKVTKN